MNYTDAELLAFLKGHGAVQAWELAYAFGGTKQKHAARLSSLAQRGALVKVGKSYRLSA